ncbi:MAG: PilT/PilU family type 4a pilus ATPase [Deltaproteobacteria bacterium]|nr:PilT/PilU family type 4a pilus ATPase [Deltaproteobacteria bacterium]
MPVLEKVFKAAIDFKASDVHIAPGEPYVFRQFGRLRKVKSDQLTQAQCRQIICELLSETQQKQLNEEMQLDFAVEFPGLGRFRGSAMMHNTGMSASFRIIPPEIPQLQSLGLPDVVERVLDNHQGLILVTGATGHGKSTTLASMIDYININRAHHVLTVEDPIEFVHPLKKGVVNQRQLGEGTRSYGNALKGALREDPDVIMIGELRDLDTISLAISAAETGHLVIATLSTSSAPKTIDRIIDSYPPEEQSQIRAMLSEALKAVVTQRLIPGSDGKSMQLAVEVLIGTLPMANLIRDGKTFQIPSLMQTAKGVGMQLIDDSIQELLQNGKITAREAYLNAANKNKFKALLDKEQGDGND